ncbi:hypothetical protein [Clostridium magnum]|uniref:Uncharacterized protein n=1 Tax=Clostridium magnum DSM 2767 TaxID=1121326 RepID=A0A161X469_9CLOT|nr:hypothetical protein [Clostridium magnum]KZL88656.1 hypothetical protein CLMAG_59450 [Clostridium magnum DSM 2767]KZL88746.1 hypothetical protein CLMAG_60350 [Clostridium magnum DSM 2767]SHJ61427.1 hypothetical protein SAMN02745944_06235 [Clostridium magnum DSM 2767]
MEKCAACSDCDVPFLWNVLNEDDKNVTVKCGTCGKEITFKHYGKCPDCGFWLDDSKYCEMCDKSYLGNYEENDIVDEKCPDCGFAKAHILNWYGESDSVGPIKKLYFELKCIHCGKEFKHTENVCNG